MAKGGARPNTGRPKGSVGTHTLEAIAAREVIRKKLEEALEPILDKAVKQAIKGDRHAREWLADRAYGKSPQAISLPEGNGEIIIRWRT